MIDGRTQVVGLLGWPVEHSLSPAMQNAAFEALRLNWRYVALPVSPGRTRDAIRGLAALGFRGANVTVPHKTLAVDAVDRLSEESSALGAINTVCVESDGTLVGHNTDWHGFLTSLVDAGFDPRGKTAVVAGAGGGARAAVYGLLRAGAQRITVLSRTIEQAERLVSDMDEDTERLHVGRLADAVLVEAAANSALLVQATPVGMDPKADDSIWPETVPFPSEMFVYDLVYVPRRTRLLRQAEEAGARRLGGLAMLVAQGARSFELWTGCKAPIEVMENACETASRRIDG